MKNLFYLCAIVLGMYACNSSKQSTNAPNLVADSTSYELLVFDNGFDLYLATKAKPMNFYSQDYYENWNQRYCVIWNSNYFSGKQPDLYGSSIDYDTQVDYGLELNYRLYNYFQYFEQSNGVVLLHRKGK